MLRSAETEYQTFIAASSYIRPRIRFREFKINKHYLSIQSSKIVTKMQFYTLALSLLASSALCAASPLPQAAKIPPSTSSAFTGKKAPNGKLNAQPAPNTQADQALQKRQVGAAIVTIKVVAIVAKIAIEIATDTLKKLGEWNGVSSTLQLS
jgi:hypothetical protein